MEKIEYREAVFNVIRTLSCERTRMKDAANNYLHTHWDILVEVNWQPAMVAYTRAPGELAPVATPGTLPGATDLALLTRLLQPRGLLKITAGGSVILETPAIGANGIRMPCDVKNGPSVDSVGVPMMVGQRHWVVTLHIVADVRDVDTSVSGNKLNAVISNLWVGTEDVDYQRRSVRRFAGRAILRADVMRAANINANTFRDLYLFQCPAHYQRQNVSVHLSEDGTVLDWSFEDAMRGYDLGPTAEHLDIECFRTGYIKAGSPAKIAMDVARGTALDMINAATTGPAAIISAAAAIPGRTAVSILDNLPKCYIHCRCDLTGDRNADLGRLTAIALGVVCNQVGITLASLLTGTAELIFRQDLADKVYTSVELTLQWSDDAAFVVAAGFAAAGHANAAINALSSGSLAMVNKFLTDSRRLNVFALSDGLPNIAAARDGSHNTNPPMTQGAYGVIPQPIGTVSHVPTGAAMGSVPTGIETLIVQALLGQNQAPPPSPPSLGTQS